MAKRRKTNDSIEIRIDRVKNVRDFNIAGQTIRKNAPEKYSVRTHKKGAKIELKNVEDVEKASIAGIEIVDYREKDFKTALTTLENVIAKSSLAGEQKKEFRDLARQI